jgi:hypothetical protein
LNTNTTKSKILIENEKRKKKLYNQREKIASIYNKKNIISSRKKNTTTCTTQTQSYNLDKNMLKLTEKWPKKKKVT